ncbi:PREDICTED: uncharacterized protein LOC106147947, partial [Chinchilla lanigera]|uniref:uncharacterized protein LOC106147947 n=1 Tax=Chinchilla lanigera TaxID=34839 RepID=UPI0006963463
MGHLPSAGWDRKPCALPSNSLYTTLRGGKSLQPALLVRWGPPPLSRGSASTPSRPASRLSEFLFHLAIPEVLRLGPCFHRRSRLPTPGTEGRRSGSAQQAAEPGPAHSEPRPEQRVGSLRGGDPGCEREMERSCWSGRDQLEQLCSEGCRWTSQYRKQIERIYEKAFKFYFQNLRYAYGRNNTFLCFKVIRERDNKLDKGVFLNQVGPQRLHAELRFLS